MNRLQKLNELHKAIPNGDISIPVLGASYILDSNGDILGHIDYKTGKIFVNKKHDNKQAFLDRLRKLNLYFEMKEYFNGL